MMNKTTAASLTATRATFGTREFSELEFDNLHLPTRLQTLVNYHVVERIDRVTRCYYTVQELVNELNDCAGEDCYGCYWHFEVDEQGRAFQDMHSYSYRVVEEG